MYPFVEQVVSILFPGWYDLLTLWRTNLFVKFDCLFTTEDLSGMLKTASLKTIDICIGVQDHCQLSVCIRHVHCLKLDKHTMSLDNEDLASLQTGHTRAIKECLYGVSAGYLGNLPENMVEPFARTSGEWQHFMHIPEGWTEIKLREFTVKEVWKYYLAPVKTQACCCYICYQDIITEDRTIPCSHIMQLPQQSLVEVFEPRTTNTISVIVNSDTSSLILSTHPGQTEQ